MFGLSPKELLELSVLAAGVTTLGNLLALFIKDYFLARQFERWKTAQTLLAVYRKYRDPMVLSAVELARRLDQICDEYPTNFLDVCLLQRTAVRGPESVTTDDESYRRYKLVSSVYRLCAFLGWRSCPVNWCTAATVASSQPATGLR